MKRYDHDKCWKVWLEKEELMAEIKRLYWMMSVKMDGEQSLLDTYNETNPAWIDAMMYGIYGEMPERLKDV